jgi:hypothetical protein
MARFGDPRCVRRQRTLSGFKNIVIEPFKSVAHVVGQDGTSVVALKAESPP